MKTAKVVLLIMTLAFLLSCNDDNDGLNDSNSNYRISEIIELEDGIEKYKSTFSYTDEKLTLMTQSYKNGNTWEESRKYEVSYNGSTVNVLNYEKDPDWELDGKREFVFNNDLMTQETYYSNSQGSLTVSYRYKYLFNGTTFIGFEEYESYSSGNLELEYKGECVYSNNILTELNEFRMNDGEWQLYSIEAFTYTNNKLKEIISSYRFFTGAFYEDDKDVYTYNGDLVSAIDDYDWNSDSDTWDLDDTITFIYNDLDYLIEVNEYNDKTILTYEEGKGNAKLLMETPENLIYQEPTFNKETKKEVKKLSRIKPLYSILFK